MYLLYDFVCHVLYRASQSAGMHRGMVRVMCGVCHVKEAALRASATSSVISCSLKKMCY